MISNIDGQKHKGQWLATGAIGVENGVNVASQSTRKGPIVPAS